MPRLTLSASCFSPAHFSHSAKQVGSGSEFFGDPSVSKLMDPAILGQAPFNSNSSWRGIQGASFKELHFQSNLNDMLSA